MKYNRLGNTDLEISELSFGTWAIGGAWGETNDEDALAALETAMENGVNFFDTADVYGMGHSEELLAQATKGKEKEIYIATKFGRQGDFADPANYTPEQVRQYAEDSLKRLNRDRIDLYQIHCPTFEILKDGSVFEVLEDLKAEGKIRYYGVSVETVEEGLYVLEHTNASSLQIIFNIFRQKPLDELIPKAREKQVGILARVPLASGLLTGKFNKQHIFEEDDHRNFNQNGEAFNVGETFAGLEFSKGVELSEELQWISKGRGNMSRAALKWIMQQDGITSVIPGFRNVRQVQDNLKALEAKDYTNQELEQMRMFYNEQVHDHIRGVY
ncbi:aldo/keto reductase [Halobacillus sp. K22]|uniref:aldo/keto reductase n=1 Tax=Halobacillus sp. K22 TaxID=3457431 RepID=UPI003FCDF12A